MENKEHKPVGHKTEHRMEHRPVQAFHHKKRFYHDFWKMSVAVLAVLLLIAIFTKGFSFGKTLSKDDMKKITEDYVNKLTQGQAKASVTEITEENGLYKLKLNVGGQMYNSYATKDGKLLFPQSVDMSADLTAAQPAETEVQKAKKATGELYIFSYCPAGTAALDSFAKAAKTLKGVADLRVKFFSNMHGDHEKQQNIIQECIQEVDSSKYWDYAAQYVEKIYKVCGPTRDVTCNKNESVKLMKSAGINSDSVMSCVAQKGETLYKQDQADAAALQLQYSPSVVVNGAYIGDADRTPEGLKTLICSGFNEAPAACSQTLSATAATSSGSCS